MPKSNIHIDQDALQRAIQPGLDELQERLNAELQSTIREVRDKMSGQPADAVYAELVGRLEQRIEGFHPNEEQLREIAVAIQDGTLED